MIFASEATGPHISISAEKIFSVGGFDISNSQLYGIFTGILIVFLMITVAKKMRVKSGGGLIQFVEIGAEFVIGLFASSMNDRKKAIKYAPFFCSIFFFILLNNWLGLLPGVGPAIEMNGSPLFRPFTADLNGTLALAICAIVTVQYCAIKENGGLNHLKHYFGGNFKNPINLFVGLLEMFGELTRVISLSLRLFFNVLIGEILISIFTYLGHLATPLTTLPFVGMEIFVGLVQSYIFTMLCATYLGIATSHSGDDHHAEVTNGSNEIVAVTTG